MPEAEASFFQRHPAIVAHDYVVGELDVQQPARLAGVFGQVHILRGRGGIARRMTMGEDDAVAVVADGLLENLGDAHVDCVDGAR